MDDLPNKKLHNFPTDMIGPVAGDYQTIVIGNICLHLSNKKSLFKTNFPDLRDMENILETSSWH